VTTEPLDIDALLRSVTRDRRLLVLATEARRYPGCFDCGWAVRSIERAATEPGTGFARQVSGTVLALTDHLRTSVVEHTILLRLQAEAVPA